MLIDTHCHLDAAEFADDRSAQIDAARAAGVGRFLVPAVDAGNLDAVAALSAAHADCRHAFGIHPMYVARAQADDLERIRSRLADGSAVAVGEIGLDAYVPDGDLPRQTEFFEAQLRLARTFDLPVVLHIRRAQDAVLGALRRIRVRGGIAHAFNGSRQQAEAFIGLGFKLGFGGAMTYSGSRRIRELAATLPLDALVLETDAPDIPPAWAARQRNLPANLRRIAAELAALRGMDEAELIAATGRNAVAVIAGLR
ncbi:MAG TPA: TatD family hydrolase [Zoogloea sp.]|uniref:TatD family hydrolase n=1 Tax=Zoogloea sp. TaxID=49181 RepID=UPI002BD4DFE3|nr:TatD family hydrolase [Zoogloea sp.]HMV18222.1 TatD family hydrolase [Rhodocyclaceae bacterium]HMV63892.1 TatD family hydrolase [Rhodocyclaceae bacterium]HMY48942.1 TatD family hydrolase [Rhodocyclaceae bacterium]HMZ75733.1 TatD family hydrolase [Rhodocyclaceae bacterium]HNA67702.1 TatD family hydrolase [Rhodocyclaceae bacterium]